MFSTYMHAVLQHYQLKKTSGELPIRLRSPSPAKIRDHLEHYLSTAFDPAKDSQVLEAFIGRQQDAAAYVKAVKNVEIDDFRPVINWLKGKTLTPEDKQVHLAALLLDFERPYEFGRDYSLDKMDGKEAVKTGEQKDVNNGHGKTETINEAEDLVEESINEDGESDDVELPDGEVLTEEILGEDKSAEKQETSVPDVVPVFEKDNGKKNKWRLWLNSNGGRRTIIPLSVLVAISLGFVIKGTIDDPKGKQCMYWKDDRYVAIACDAKLPEETKKIALDTFLLNNFRMITKPDTITERSIGKLWYLKYQKNFDYFTVRGVHPIHGKKLSRLSDLIYRNEIDEERKEKASSL